MPRPRTHTYAKIAFRAVPAPASSDPLTDLLSAVKALPVDRALAVSCLPGQLNAVRQRVAVLGGNLQFKRFLIHTKRTAAGAFLVWITPRQKKGVK